MCPQRRPQTVTRPPALGWLGATGRLEEPSRWLEELGPRGKGNRETCERGRPPPVSGYPTSSALFLPDQPLPIYPARHTAAGEETRSWTGTQG